MSGVVSLRCRAVIGVSFGLLLGCAFGLRADVGDPYSAEHKALLERIAPVGKVCLEGEPCASAVAVSASQPSVATEDLSPASLYIRGCAACHDAGVNDAPKIGDRAAWRARRNAGIETLYEHAINGYGAMPARGVCIGCSDEQVRASVDYLLEKSR